MECSSGYIWISKKCSKIQLRTIPGYHRDCVECGISNYNPGDGSCKACLFPATECDDDRDYSCKEELGFLIGEESERCECVNGTFHNGKCICQIANHFVDEDYNCLPCNFTTRDEKGCDPDCPNHTFDVGKDCKPCHYSCDECTGLTEGTCNECAYPFQYVESVNLCLCPCNSYQHNNGCKCIDGYILVDRTCELIKGCIGGQYFNNVTQQCEFANIDDPIVNGERVLQPIKICPENFTLVNNTVCVAIPTKKCQPPLVLTDNDMCDCPPTQILYEGVCVDINCPKNALIINRVCNCPTGMRVKNWVCVFLKEDECPSEGMVLDSGRCVCPSGTIDNFVKGICLEAKPENCPYKNQVIFNGVCECAPLYFLRGDACVLMVEANCPQNMRVDYVLLECVCKSGYILSVNETCVPCSSGTIYSNGACLINPYSYCPVNSILNQFNVCVTQMISVCPPGTTIKDGYCLSN
jgi:hypothetical protein